MGEVIGRGARVWDVRVGGGHSGRGGEGEEGGEGIPSPSTREGLLGSGSPSHTTASLARRRGASRPGTAVVVTHSGPSACGGWRPPSGEAGGVGEGAKGGEAAPAPPCPAGGLNITVPVLESPASSDDVVPDEVLGDDTPPTGEVHSGDAPPLGPAPSSAGSARRGGDWVPGGVVTGVWSGWGLSRWEARSLSEVVREPTLPCMRRQRVRVDATTPLTPPPSLTTLPELSRRRTPTLACRALSLRATRVPSRRASPSWPGQSGRKRRGLACCPSGFPGDVDTALIATTGTDGSPADAADAASCCTCSLSTCSCCCCFCCCSASPHRSNTRRSRRPSPW